MECGGRQGRLSHSWVHEELIPQALIPALIRIKPSGMAEGMPIEAARRLLAGCLTMARGFGLSGWQVATIEA